MSLFVDVIYMIIIINIIKLSLIIVILIDCLKKKKNITQTALLDMNEVTLVGCKCLCFIKIVGDQFGGCSCGAIIAI